MKSIGDIVLIIIGFILIFTLVGFFASNVGLLSNLTKNVPSIGVTDQDTKTTVTDTCGMVLFNPTVNEKVYTPIVVRGYAETKCGWVMAADGYLGSATLYTSRNAKVAENKLNVNGGTTNGIINFEGRITYNSDRYFDTEDQYKIVITGKSAKGNILTRTIEVNIPANNDPYVGAGCQVAGCSSEVCSEKGQLITTTCQFEPQYACYQSQYARCEKQRSGQCGWSMDTSLRQCLNRY